MRGRDKGTVPLSHGTKRLIHHTDSIHLLVPSNAMQERRRDNSSCVPVRCMRAIPSKVFKTRIQFSALHTWHPLLPDQPPASERMLCLRRSSQSDSELFSMMRWRCGSRTKVVYRTAESQSLHKNGLSDSAPALLKSNI